MQQIQFRQIHSVPSTPAWARPGVYWFRTMGFPSKAGVILALLVLPLLVTLAVLMRDRMAVWQATRAERVGLAAVQHVLPAMEATQLLRRALVDHAQGVPRSDLPALKERFKQSMDTLVQQVKPTLDKLDDPGDEHWAPVVAARAAAESQAADLPAAEVRKPYVALTQGLGELVQHLVDKSGLALDPEGDTYYLMLLATVQLPQVMDTMGQTRAALASHLKAPDNATLRQAAARLATDKTVLHHANSALKHVRDFNQQLDVARLGAGLAPATAFVERGEALLAKDAADPALASAVVLEATAALQKLGETQQLAARELDTLLQAREQRLVQRAAAGALLSLLLLAAGLYFFYCFYRAMRSGMNTLVMRMQAMARGDLTDALQPKGKDETAMLLGALAEMQHALRHTVREVRVAADAIIQSSSEVASGSMDLSQRTEQAAANLEETSSAMEQIGATVSNTTDGARQAAEVAAANAQLAQQGGAVIAQVVGTMSEIQDSSRRIGEIIGVIDGIAFQTNILALNAAVEAARAGEQGRGFAVVAAEVRSLAQRSADAAREIKQLILDSVERVENGHRIVGEAGSTINAIVASTARVGDLLKGIATGASEQAAGIEQVGHSISELDQMTQQNAALVEQTASASTAMRDNANQLAQAVNAFKLPA